MTDTDTVSMGSDQIAAIDNMFGNATPVQAADGDTGGDSAEEFDTEQLSAEAGDSEGQADEAVEQEAQTEEQPAVADPQDRQARIDALAKEFGLDPNNPSHFKAIERMLTQEKRKADADEYINELKGKLNTSSFLTEWEKSLKEGKEAGKATATQATPARAEAPPVNGGAPQFNDGFDYWGNDVEKAIVEMNEAYTKGDIRKGNDMEAAIFNRRFHAIAMPSVRNEVYSAIRQLTGRDLAPLLEQVQSQRAEREDLEDRDFAIAELEKDPGMKKTLQQLQEPSEGMIEFEGKKWPAKPIRRIFVENPEILRVKVSPDDPRAGGDPRVANRLTWLDRYRFAARQLLKEQSANGTAPLKQLKDGFQAGVKATKQQNDQNRIRQTVNQGSRGSGGRPVSADNEFLAGLSRTSGTTGIPASSMFKTLKS